MKNKPFVRIQSDPLSIQTVSDFVAESSHGAVDIFIGQVRDDNAGRKVQAISYDAFEPLAVRIFEQICAEAQIKFGDSIGCFIAHRTGKLNVGEISILIAVSSPHRAEAFSGCRYIIEEVKCRAPVWKHEYYTDGTSEWTPGNALVHLEEN